MGASGSVVSVSVTGIGMVSPLGLSTAASFENLFAGRSGVRKLDLGERVRLNVAVAASVTDFDPVTVLGAREARRFGRFAAMAMAAAREAAKDARLEESGYEKTRVAVLQGVGIGGVDVLERACLAFDREGQLGVPTFTVPGLIPNMAAGLISIDFGAQGPSYAIAAACSSSAFAIGEGLRLLRLGIVDAVVAGGAESTLTPAGVAAFANMRTLALSRSRPFDRQRDGFVLGEGAATLILERTESALRRGARPYATLAGYAATSDAHHITTPSPHGGGAARCMRLALADACVRPAEVDYVNAHGTATVAGDIAEAEAIRDVFGERGDQVLVSSTKGASGHLLGAAGAFEGAMCALALHRGLVPPTLHLDSPDPRCPLNHVANESRRAPLQTVLSNSFGFGGQNAVLVFRRASASGAESAKPQA